MKKNKHKNTHKHAQYRIKKLTRPLSERDRCETREKLRVRESANVALDRLNERLSRLLVNIFDICLFVCEISFLLCFVFCVPLTAFLEFLLHKLKSFLSLYQKAVSIYKNYGVNGRRPRGEHRDVEDQEGNRSKALVRIISVRVLVVVFVDDDGDDFVVFQNETQRFLKAAACVKLYSLSLSLSPFKTV